LYLLSAVSYNFTRNYDLLHLKTTWLKLGYSLAYCEENYLSRADFTRLLRRSQLRTDRLFILADLSSGEKHLQKKAIEHFCVLADYGK
jgi:hypothetical protein